MEKFLAGMTAEDKQMIMENMMPKMMEGVDMMQMMPKMMMEMMPKCLGMMLPRLPKEKRIDFVSTMITTLMQQGCAGMSEEEKGNFKAKLIGKL